jgi:predicted RNA-binding protein YlxR (DUF448 family)
VRARREPERTCVGCRGRSAKGALIRVVRRSDGTVAVDPEGRAPGRGAYVHADPVCVEAAVRHGALARALRAGLGAGEVARLQAAIEREVVR